MRMLADASLPELKIAFPAPFKLVPYADPTELEKLLPKASILLCRSTLKVNKELLRDAQLDVLMTASSGRDHVDEAYLTQRQIHLLDAKGANAPAVVEYVLSTLQHLKTHHHFYPQTAGIVGYGAVGSLVTAVLQSKGLKTLIYDPFKPIGQDDLNSLSACDVVCLHPNLHRAPPHPSYHLIDEAFLKQRPKHSAIINASRGQVVDETALLNHHQGLYCTDVFANEPHIHPDVVKQATLCTPHIAGHTIEAKLDIIRLLSQKLHAYYHLNPPIFQPHSIIHQNTPYNPYPETIALKKHPTAFEDLRKKHHRHQFDYSAQKSL